MEQLESELREFQAITGKEPDEHEMVLALKRMLPKAIRDMLQTIEKDGYKEGKEYALNQARALRNERAEGPTKAGAPPLNDLDHLTVPEGLSPEEQEAFVFAKKGKGKGFKGECYNCGKSGHRAADCFAPGGGEEGGGKKGQKGGYGKSGGAITDAIFGQGQAQHFSKGGGGKGKGKAQYPPAGGPPCASFGGNAAPADGGRGRPGPNQCAYCWKEGHYKDSCPELLAQNAKWNSGW